MLVNGIKKPKLLYNVCPKTMLLSILQQTLSIHQVQLLTSLEQTKNYKHTHNAKKNRKKNLSGKCCATQSTWSNEAIYHIPPIVYNCKKAHSYCRVVSREPRRETIPKIFCVGGYTTACCSMLPWLKFVPFTTNLFRPKYHSHCIKIPVSILK